MQDFERLCSGCGKHTVIQGLYSSYRRHFCSLGRPIDYGRHYIFTFFQNVGANSSSIGNISSLPAIMQKENTALLSTE